MSLVWLQPEVMLLTVRQRFLPSEFNPLVLSAPIYIQIKVDIKPNCPVCPQSRSVNEAVISQSFTPKENEKMTPGLLYQISHMR